jgi:hypothetical protein
MSALLHSVVDERIAMFNLTSRELLERDAPDGLIEPGLVSANRHCHLFAASDGWVALNLARQVDRDTVPALTGGGDGLRGAVAATTANEFRDRAIELQLPVAVVGEAAAQPLADLGGQSVPRRVIDLSALWAGPLCAGLLARAGAEVLRIESLGRADPTPEASPRLDAFLNGQKTRLPLDLRSEAGRARLLAEIAQADVLVTSARPAALARLGLTPQRLTHLTWVAITAHGFTGPAANRVGFGDDCAAAGGLMRQEIGEPRFLGDALADPLTGLEAALAVLAGRRGLIDMAMARIAAAYPGMLGLNRD